MYACCYDGGLSRQQFGSQWPTPGKTADNGSRLMSTSSFLAVNRICTRVMFESLQLKLHGMGSIRNARHLPTRNPRYPQPSCLDQKYNGRCPTDVCILLRVLQAHRVFLFSLPLSAHLLPDCESQPTVVGAQVHLR